VANEERDMTERDTKLEQFEAHRAHLGRVAYRMLGSRAEADDAVQETWIRMSRADTSDVENVGGWLTTVLARICLNVLQARRSRPEVPVGAYVPDPVVTSADQWDDPEQEALTADAVGLALLAVLETLSPAERLAFVLHDMFAIPFGDIAAITGRTPDAARQLASRGRRRVRGAEPAPVDDPARQREVVEAYFAASREGDFDALVALLDPEAVLRADGGAARPEATVLLRGAEQIAGRALMFSRYGGWLRPALVNGLAGVVVAPHGRPFSIMAFTVAGGRIVAIDALVDPERLARLDLSAVGLT
jgi:RNA polymerase sigma-70 factor (ECF subfamily)